MTWRTDLDIDACVTILGTCPVDYNIAGNLVEFHYGGAREGFYFAFDASALRKLTALGDEAIAQLEAPTTG